MNSKNVIGSAQQQSTSNGNADNRWYQVESNQPVPFDHQLASTQPSTTQNPTTTSSTYQIPLEQVPELSEPSLPPLVDIMTPDFEQWLMDMDE